MSAVITTGADAVLSTRGSITSNTDARLDRMVTVNASVMVGPPLLRGGRNKPYGRSPITFRDGRGNPPDLGILGFPLPLEIETVSQGRSLALTTVNVYLKEDRGEEAEPRYAYHHLESRGIHGVHDFWEWYYFLLTAVHGEQYAVNWTLPDGTITPGTPVDAEVYFPPMSDRDRKHSNAARTTEEHVRRVMLTDRQHGEHVIFLRRKVSGAVCGCYNDRLSEVSRKECGICFGVGFEGGYDVFPRIMIRYLPIGTKISANEFGLIVDASPRVWTMIVPEMADRDAIVRQLPKGRLRAFILHNVTRKPLEGPAAIPIIQEFSLKQMEYHEQIYSAMKHLLPHSLFPVESSYEPGLPRRFEIDQV